MGHEVMNQQCLLHEVPLDRNTHKTRLCIDRLMKMIRPEAHGVLMLYFLEKQLSLFVNSVFAMRS